MAAFQDPELLNPGVHAFARCFVCKKLIAISEDENDELILTERTCPHCGAFNNDEQISWSFALNTAHTAGITSSNKIQSLDLAFIPFLVAHGLVTFTGFPLWILIPNLIIYAGPVVIILQWLYRYWYEVRFEDEEYLEAVSGVRKSLFLWLTANLLGWTMMLLRPSFILYW